MTEDALAQPIPLRVLIDEAVKHVRRHFAAMYLPVAIPLAAAAGFVPLVQAIWFKDLTNAQTRGANPFAALPALGAMMLVVLMLVAVHLLANTAMVIGSVDALSGVPVSMGRAWRKALDLRVVGTVLLSGLVIGLGFVCCLLPGIYAAVLFSLVVPVMAAEQRFGIDAMTRSRELMAHNPRQEFASDPRVKAFVVLFVGWLLEYAIGMTIGIPLAAVQQFLMMRGLAEGTRMDPAALMAKMVWFQVPANMLGTLGRAAVSLYVSFALSLLFFDLRGRREGTDLEAAIEGLTSTPPGDAPA